MPFGYRFSHKSRIFKTPRALCPDYPTWEVYIDVPVGKKIEWKALKKGTDSTITWQSGSNNLYTVPDDGGCGETASSWR